MSILDTVRKKYKTPMSETDKTDKSPLGSFISPTSNGSESFSSTKLRLLAGPDWPEIKADPDQLVSFKAAAETAVQIQRGIIPIHYTATTDCKHCGSVPIFDGCPPKVNGCPWCFNRLAGTPVPQTAAK